MSVTVVLEHLLLVFLSVVFTVAVGVPMGVAAYMYKPLRSPILWLSEILQTIPALALLGVIMAAIGPGKLTVVIGLVLYSMLPVVQNTCLGLSSVDPGIKEAALGMGMTKMYRLFHVEFPVSFPVIFTGIRIATVTSVGVAVFAAFVGGGGLGALIYRGIRIQSMPMILSGTLALMIMAIAFDVGMSLIERWLQRLNRPRK